MINLRVVVCCVERKGREVVCSKLALMELVLIEKMDTSVILKEDNLKVLWIECKCVLWIQRNGKNALWIECH